MEIRHSSERSNYYSKFRFFYKNVSWACKENDGHFAMISVKDERLGHKKIGTLSDAHKVSDILFYSQYRNATRRFSPSEIHCNWHWDWLVAALETLFTDTLTHTSKGTHGYKQQKTFIVGLKQHFVFAQHRLAVKYDNTDPSDTEKKNLHYHSLKYCQRQMAFNTFGLNKKRKDKKQTRHTCPVLQSLYGEILITFSSHKMPCEGATGDSRLLNVTVIPTLLLPSTSLFVAPFFCTGFKLNNSDMKNNFGFIQIYFIYKAEHS